MAQKTDLNRDVALILSYFKKHRIQAVALAIGIVAMFAFVAPEILAEFNFSATSGQSKQSHDGSASPSSPMADTSNASIANQTDAAGLEQLVSGHVLLVTLQPNGVSESWNDSRSNEGLMNMVYQFGNGFMQLCFVSDKDNRPHDCSPALQLARFGSTQTNCFGNVIDESQPEGAAQLVCVSDIPVPGATASSSNGYDKMTIPAGVPYLQQRMAYGAVINRRFRLSPSADQAKPPASSGYDGS